MKGIETAQYNIFCTSCLALICVFIAACGDSQSEELTREDANQWGAFPVYMRVRFPEPEGFPISVQYRSPLLSTEKSYETWITQREKLAGVSPWLENSVTGNAFNRVFAASKSLVDAVELVRDSDESNSEAQLEKLENARKTLDQAEIRNLKLYWPDEYREAIERGELGFLRVSNAKVEWESFRQPRSRGLRYMVNLRVTFSVSNSSENESIYVENAFYLVDSDEALIKRVGQENQVALSVEPGTTSDFTLSTQLMPYSELEESQPAEIVNILRGIRFEVPPIPQLSEVVVH